MFWQHSLTSTGKRLFQRAPLCECFIKMKHKGGADVILERKRHRNDSRNLRHDKRGGKGGIERDRAMLMARTLPQNGGSIAGRQHDQAHVATDKEFTQRLSIDIPIASLLIAKAQVCLCHHPAVNGMTFKVFTLVS